MDDRRIRITGKAVTVDGNDIDTDRIIPARFLRCVTFDGLGQHAFEDARRQLQEAGLRHPFDDPARAEARILVVDRNFGCGSSREHAPQALLRWKKGISAIVGESFADIFFGNCVALGIPCVTASKDDLWTLKRTVVKNPTLELSVDLEKNVVEAGDLTIKVSMSESSRRQLLSGRWDSSTELLEGGAQVKSLARTLPFFGTWRT
jgi:3-isopropylmalate/(R)-2-methylmalate dehydratase small subunit